MPRKSKIKKCVECSKSVYANEELKAMDKIFHTTCFNCKTCKCKLTLITYCDGEGSQYCKTHYAENFGAKGYGYGGAAAGDFTQHKKKQATNKTIVTKSVSLKPAPRKGKHATRKKAPAKKRVDSGVSRAKLTMSISKGAKLKPAKVKAATTKSKGKGKGIKKCTECGKSVYANEQLQAMNKIFHATCFTCKTCNCKLTFITYCDGEGSQYCKTHYAEKYGAKGYGFGGATAGDFSRHKTTKPKKPKEDSGVSRAKLTMSISKGANLKKTKAKGRGKANSVGRGKVMIAIAKPQKKLKKSKGKGRGKASSVGRGKVMIEIAKPQQKLKKAKGKRGTKPSFPAWVINEMGVPAGNEGLYN